MVQALTTNIIMRSGIVIIKWVHVNPATVGNQYNSRIEVSNNVRVLVHVDMLGRRYVHSHRFIGLLASPCTNGSNARAVVQPSGRPLMHVGTVRTTSIDRSCIVAKANERPAGHSCTRSHRWNGEYDVHHRVEVDQKENSR